MRFVREQPPCVPDHLGYKEGASFRVCSKTKSMFPEALSSQSIEIEAVENIDAVFGRAFIREAILYWSYSLLLFVFVVVGSPNDSIKSAIGVFEN
ncbi:hypothetical protein CCP2SC5_600017 [Azospirillaceae bacterium]